jgi:carboxylesterase type B
LQTSNLWNFDFTLIQIFPFTGLFHRSISQSGTATCGWAVKRKGRPKALAEQVAGLFDCPAHPSEDLISCLRKQDAYKLYSADLAVKVSCHKHAENITKLHSNKTSNYHLEHSRPGSTN